MCLSRGKEEWEAPGASLISWAVLPPVSTTGKGCHDSEHSKVGSETAFQPLLHSASWGIFQDAKRTTPVFFSAYNLKRPLPSA